MEMTLKQAVEKKYMIFSLTNLADQMHKYPDEAWKLLSEYYYHYQMAERIEQGDIAEKWLQGQDKSKVIADHDNKNEILLGKLKQKWPELVVNAHKLVEQSSIKSKFDKWLNDPRVFNPLGDPKVSYLDL